MKKKNKAIKATNEIGKRRNTRYRILTNFFELVFLVGAGILLYPTISNQWNTYRQQQLISDYKDVVETNDTEDLDSLWEEAREYNRKHGESNIYDESAEDAFSENSDETERDNDIEDSEYYKVLNPAGDGTMGYISIPKINIKIPIYHGVSEDALKKGAGHLSGSQLPIGGEGNHAVLAAHRGLPTAKLFSDLDELQEGDQFYLYILDDILAYEVDQILPMVEMNDTETLSEATKSVKGEDYVTLYTCTPYGVNTHRLLVRGHRVPYMGEEEETPANAILQAVRNYYMLFLLIGVAVTALGIMIIRTVIRVKNKRKIRSQNE